MKLIFLLFFCALARAASTDEISSSSAPTTTTTEKPKECGNGIVDYNRPCPAGFFYAGEPSCDELKNEAVRGMWAEKGPASPVYSCYRVEKEQMDWPTANRRCWEKEAQLLSVNNLNEDKIIINEKFTKMLSEGSVERSNSVLSSGINLGDGYIWFATGEQLTDDQSSNLPANSSCVVISRENSSLTFAAAPCVSETANYTAVCEVRVYVQTWYVWFFDNWLQLLFLFTLVLLIISACLTLQVWTSRPSRRPTNARTSTTTNNNVTLGFNNNKYVHKGKELLAKVVFYSPSKPEDKEKLANATQA